MKIIPAILIASIALALGAILPVKADETPTPSPTPLPEARVVIVLDAPSGVCADFDVDTRRGEHVRDFSLCGNRERTFRLEDGRYLYKVTPTDGYLADDVRCRGPRSVLFATTGNDEAFLAVHDGDEVRCVFSLKAAPTPTPTPEPTSTPVVATQTPVVIVRERVVTVVATPQPVQQIAGSSFVIKPPSTGSAGLLP